jgi:hypothetical protein
MGPFTEKDLAMEDKHGWQFWYNDNGRIRQFMVGHENEETAKRAIQTHDPNLTDLNCVTSSRVSWDLIALLGLVGTGIEWNPVDKNSSFRIGGQ